MWFPICLSLEQQNDHAHTIRKLMKDTEFASVKEEELINNMQV